MLVMVVMVCIYYRRCNTYIVGKWKSVDELGELKVHVTNDMDETPFAKYCRYFVTASPIPPRGGGGTGDIREMRYPGGSCECGCAAAPQLAENQL